MLLDRYFDSIDMLFEKVRTSQRQQIIQAGELIAASIENGGCIHVGPICHGTEGDIIYRGGGPLFYRKFVYKLTVENQTRVRDRSDLDTNMEGLAAYALKASQVRPGDVLIVSSVSGRSANIVDLAFEAVRMGVKVIALTSLTYAIQVDPVHSSGKKLHEMVDLAIDNCAPAAEAMLKVEGIEARFAAASGIASDYILWSMTAVAVETLLAHGKTPGILKSANFPGGNDYNKKVVEPQYEQYGW